MKIENTLNTYRKVRRYAGMLQLAKLLTEHKEMQDQEEGEPVEVVTGRDWELVNIPRTPETEVIISGEGESQKTTDPVAEDFDTYFAQGMALEYKTKRDSLKMEARRCRWDTMDSLVLTSGPFTNLGAERNASLLRASIEEYRDGEPLQWLDLNTQGVVVDDTNIAYLEALSKKTTHETQRGFDIVVEIAGIVDATPDGDLEGLDIRSLWDARWNKEV